MKSRFDAVFFGSLLLAAASMGFIILAGKFLPINIVTPIVVGLDIGLMFWVVKRQKALKEKASAAREPQT